MCIYIYISATIEHSTTQTQRVAGSTHQRLLENSMQGPACRSLSRYIKRFPVFPTSIGQDDRNDIKHTQRPLLGSCEHTLENCSAFQSIRQSRRLVKQQRPWQRNFENLMRGASVERWHQPAHARAKATFEFCTGTSGGQSMTSSALSSLYQSSTSGLAGTAASVFPACAPSSPRPFCKL